jgi:hypothetical protein
MQAGLGTRDANVTANVLANGRTNVSPLKTASVDWSQHRVSFSRIDRTAFSTRIEAAAKEDWRRHRENVSEMT